MRQRVLIFWIILTMSMASLNAAQARTFTVNSTNDTGGCDVNNICSSLRGAIDATNANPGADMINFSIPGAGVHTITPAFTLPIITDPVTIDGTTQPGFTDKPVIELNGSRAGNVHGLTISAGNSTVRGLVINRFNNLGFAGILLQTNGNNTIEGNFIGTDATGTINLGNGHGVGIIDSPNNRIGGTNGTTPGGPCTGACNLISGNKEGGVGILNPGSTGNIVQSNFIGTDVTGMKDIGNSEEGVLISAVVGSNSYASNNTIGGTNGIMPGRSCAGACNLISGNDGPGVEIFGINTNDNTVQGNFIGTDITGTKTLGNLDAGVLISRASNNTIGGTIAEARNIISGNSQDGIQISGGINYAGAPFNDTSKNKIQGNFIGTNITGSGNLSNGGDGVVIITQIGGGNASSNMIGGAIGITPGGPCTGACNLISGNNFRGIVIAGTNTTNNQVQGNFIGTDINGIKDLGNTLDGIRITTSTESSGGASNNTIGGDTPNLISGNKRDGVSIAFGSNRNKLQGNFIGTDIKGTSALGNIRYGILIDNGSDNMIGKNGARNIISGNGNAGIAILNISSQRNLVQGNFIGTNITGTNAIGNLGNGILIQESNNNTIGGMTEKTLGGPCTGSCNVISGNDQNGVVLEGNNNTLQGNFIGTDVNGNNKLRNFGAGVLIHSSNNTIGDTGNLGGNLISGNNLNGIEISFGPATMNKVNGNFIGTNTTGAGVIGNNASGVLINEASNNTIGGLIGITPGGPCTGACNIISNNNQTGVTVSGLSAINNTIRGNDIHNNSGLGIDLGGDGVTPNDQGDADSGPNDLLNFPVGVTAYFNGSHTIISGILSTASPNLTTVDIYANQKVNPSGFGEGQLYLGNTTPTSSGNFNLTLDGSLPAGFIFVSATATDSNGSTSEFSPVCGDPDGDGNTDDDGDGLCDDWETNGPSYNINGIDFNGDGVVDLDLQALGANPKHKDIFVEVDYMMNNTLNFLPDQIALQNVVNAFANAPVANPDGSNGIYLHPIVDEALPMVDDISFDNRGPDAADDFDDLKLGSNDPSNPGNPCGTGTDDGHFGTITDRISLNCFNILGAKRLVFRYAIFGNIIENGSGKAEFAGNDFLIALGGRFRDAATDASKNWSTTSGQEYGDMQAGTFMHELGHSLGLYHGGDDKFINCKPNYLSVMNYARQFNTEGNASDIPGIANDTKVRTNRTLDYSHGPPLPTLNENSLNENNGIGGPVGQLTLFGDGSGKSWVGPTNGPIDWNHNGVYDASASSDINFIKKVSKCNNSIPGQSLTGFDDWSHLIYNFRFSNDFDDGANRITPDSVGPELTSAEVNNLLTGGSIQPLEGSISGVKFYDINGNGTKDAGEPGIANWTITLINQTGNVVTTITDAVGNYNFTNLATGNYTVNEVQQAGWTQTFPASGIYNITISTGQNMTGIDFGNFVQQVPTFNISGFKVNNETKSGISDWNITLMNSTMQTSMLTVVDGSYQFTNLVNGTYTVTETMQAGWTNVSPISQQVTINGANKPNINFTNQPLTPTFNISGFKINNATGSGLQGWNITLMNSTMQTSMLTVVDGSYQFTNLVNGTYTVTETMQAGWTNVSPISQQVTINGANKPNINFTNQQLPTPPPPPPPSPPPPPPVLQNIGIYDTSIDKLIINATFIINATDQTACRTCHQSTGTNISGGYNNTLGGVPTRHHNMVQEGVINPYTNVPFGCTDCHPSTPEIRNGVLLDRSCTDCHNTTNFWADSVYGARVGNLNRPHHYNTSYDDANIGNAPATRHCNFCHGSFVDNYDDGHYIPSYNTTFMITPFATWKATSAVPIPPPAVFDSSDTQVLNKTWGGCESCHLGTVNNTGFNGTGYPDSIGTNHNNHHREILGGNVTNNGTTVNLGARTPFVNVSNICSVCHIIDYQNLTGHRSTFPLRINITDGGTGLTDTGAMEVRNSTIEQTEAAIEAFEPGTTNVTINGTGCEKCHDVKSLHNIQYQYQQNGPQGLGHINNNTDCYGCHNSWLPADTWIPGPIIPTVGSVSPAVIPAGTATTLTITGTDLQNPDGTYPAVVTVDGITYTPSSITDAQLTINLPALTAGVHQLRLLKGGDTLSKLVTLTVVTNPTITSVTYTPANNVLSITGTGFGTKPATNSQLYVTVNHAGNQIAASSVSKWSDKQITAKISGVASGDQATVLTTTSGEAVSAIK